MTRTLEKLDSGDPPRDYDGDEKTEGGSDSPRRPHHRNEEICDWLVKFNLIKPPVDPKNGLICYNGDKELQQLIDDNPEMIMRDHESKKCQMIMDMILGEEIDRKEEIEESCQESLSICGCSITVSRT